jgi:putative tricarboxylic transport membrane protein
MSRVRPTPLTAFLCVLMAVLAAYTWLAWDMDWRAAAGRLGPGFFPRVIGVAGVVLCAVAAVRSLRRTERPGEPERARRPRHPWPLAAAAAGLAVFLVLFIPLGALFAPALFIFGMSWLLRREHIGRNAVLSVLISVFLYGLFELVLDAGLPEGLLVPLPT